MTFDTEDGSENFKRKLSYFNSMGIPMALQIDEQLKSLPEPQRTDYQILVDERADELVHIVMNKYRDRIWKEMAEARKNYSTDVENFQQELQDNFVSEGEFFIDPVTR